MFFHLRISPKKLYELRGSRIQQPCSAIWRFTATRDSVLLVHYAAPSARPASPSARRRSRRRTTGGGRREACFGTASPQTAAIRQSSSGAAAPRACRLRSGIPLKWPPADGPGDGAPVRDSSASIVHSMDAAPSRPARIPIRPPAGAAGIPIEVVECRNSAADQRGLFEHAGLSGDVRHGDPEREECERNGKRRECAGLVFGRSAGIRGGGPGEYRTAATVAGRPRQREHRADGGRTDSQYRERDDPVRGRTFSPRGA